ncbi:hypothetical protein V8E53_012002 [Lactarius tabidus]
MSAPIISTPNDTTISPSTIKWLAASSGVLLLFVLGTFLYLAYRRGAQRVPLIEGNHNSHIRLPHPRQHLALPVSGIPRSHLYVHRAVPSPSTSPPASLGAMPPVRREKAPGVPVLPPGTRLALV